MWGFANLKDVLDVVVVPIVLLLLGVGIPYQFERQKRNAFIKLIKREFGEMNPDPDTPKPNDRWHTHLKKRFLHEAIIGKPSENRDFILSLPPDIAYNLSQLWTHFDKAEKAMNSKELIEHGERWCDYLRIMCTIFDKKADGDLYRNIYKPWEGLIDAYKEQSEAL